MRKICNKCGQEYEAKSNRSSMCDNCKKIEKESKMRKCIVCGNPTNRRTAVPYCDECEDIIKTTRAENQPTEKFNAEKLKLKPRLIDLIDTLFLLDDFGIKVKELPDFKTNGEMLRWRKDMIKRKLGD